MSKVKIFSDKQIDELFTTCNPDIVIIAVNENSHLETALKVISKKPKLVVLEKPVALNSKEGMKIVKAAEKNKVPVCNKKRSIVWNQIINMLMLLLSVLLLKLFRI